MNILRKIKTIDSSFILGSILFFAIMLINFVITPSPYSALHSGRVGGLGIDATFAINTAYSMIASFALIRAKFKNFHFDRAALTMCFFLLVSFALNFRPSDINSYAYDIFAIILVSMMASYDVNRTNNTHRLSDKGLSYFERIIVGLIIIGFAIVFLYPGRYGYLSGNMSRDERGEVTLWVMLCLPLLILSSQLVSFMFGKIDKKKLFLAIFACFITCLTASRTALLVYFVCLFLCYITKNKNKIVVYASIPVIFYLIATSDSIRQIFFLGNSSINASNVEDILNGRYDLWMFYWDTFCDNILVGAGPNALSENVAAYLEATSEVGILKTAASYGIIPAVIEIYLIVSSFMALRKIIKNYTAYSRYDIFVAFLFIANVILIIQQHARIQNYGNLVCWYSMFYMFNLNRININGNNI